METKATLSPSSGSSAQAQMLEPVGKKLDTKECGSAGSKKCYVATSRHARSIKSSKSQDHLNPSIKWPVFLIREAKKLRERNELELLGTIRTKMVEKAVKYNNKIVPSI